MPTVEHWRAFGHKSARGIAQVQFDSISSRTYISALERGLKQPTIAKVDALAEVLGLHPLTLLALSYARAGSMCVRAALARVQREVEELAEAAGGIGA